MMNILNSVPLQDLLLFLLFLSFSAFFSVVEAIIMSISIDRIKQLSVEHSEKKRILDFLQFRSSEVLATILVGNNIVNVAASALATVVVQKIFGEGVLAYSVGFTTLVLLFFGEVAPKTFSRASAEAYLFITARVLLFFYYLFYPLVKSLTLLIKLILGENAYLSTRIITKNDIEYMVNEAEKNRSMDSRHLDLLSSILEFPSIRVKDVMVPRNQVCFLRKTATYPEIIEIIRTEAHSRYPVCEVGLDSTLGFLHVKDLAFAQPDEKGRFDIHKVIKPPFFVYEHMKIHAVFDHMNRKKVHLALVKDENGVVVGIITFEDIMEEIFGEIQDEHDSEEVGEKIEAQEDEDGLVIEGITKIRDLNNEYDLDLPDDEEYSTVAGFILDHLGNHFPKKGNIVFWKGYSFELTKVTKSEIKQVKIRDVEGDHIYSQIRKND